MYTKTIRLFGQPNVLVSCDGNCSKAWGVQTRPRVRFDEQDPDDFAYMADQEMESAPADPGTYEGGHAKPVRARGQQDMNKWCTRQCERSTTTRPGQPVVLPDLSRHRYNQPFKHGIGS